MQITKAAKDIANAAKEDVVAAIQVAVVNTVNKSVELAVKKEMSIQFVAVKKDMPTKEDVKTLIDVSKEDVMTHIDTVKKDMVTKEDAKTLIDASKADAKTQFDAVKKDMATKEDVKTQFDAVKKDMATKEDAKTQFDAIKKDMATKSAVASNSRKLDRLMNQIGTITSEG